MSKKKKRRKKRPDKRLTMAQCEKEINDALDTFEKAALEALHSEFGFGKKRQDRFMKAFKQKVYEIIIEEEKRRLQRVLS